MNKKSIRSWTLGLCAGLWLSGSGALAQGGTLWTDLGGYLNTACKLASGSVGVPIPGLGNLTPGGISSLEWLCTIRRMYGFVDGNILNGDWQSFALEVGGKYVGEMANYLGDELGLGGPQGWADGANDALRSSYRDFRAKIMNGLDRALAEYRTNHRDVADGLPVTSASGLAKVYEDSNPGLAAAAEAARLEKITQSFDNLTQAARVTKSEQESRDAIDKNFGALTEKTTKVIGDPLNKGEADSLVDKAKTAASTREVMEVGVEATASLMKQLATYNTALLTQLVEISKQSVMTNSQLGSQASNLSAQGEDRA